MSKYAEIILSAGEERDGTAYPFWAIVRETKKKNIVFLRGIWFNRPAAEDFLKRTSYNFPEGAHVYGFSGCDSGHIKDLYALAKAEREATS